MSHRVRALVRVSHKRNALRQQQKQAIHDYNQRLESHCQQSENDEKQKLEKLKQLISLILHY